MAPKPVSKAKKGSKRTGRASRSHRDGYETIFDDDALTVLQKPGKKSDCIVSFTGVGHALGGIDLQNPEFAGSADDATKFFVIDKQRSWGNNLDWSALDDLLGERTQGARVTTLGNSMGGFLALFAARRLNATHAIAFAPQWSIDPMVVPTEKRWSNYRDDIQTIRFPDLSGAFQPSTRSFVFFGDDQIDATHLQYFNEVEERPAIFVLKDCGHNVAKYLKKHGQLYSTIKACRSGEDVRSLLNRANLPLARG